MSDISVWGALFIGLVPLGQLWARVFWMNGSLDKPWLLLPFFWFPPLGLIAGFMFWMGWVQKGQGGKPPYDTWMLIPIISKFILGMFITMIANMGSSLDRDSDSDDDDDQSGGGLMTSLVIVIIQLFMNAIPHFIRLYQLCDNNNSSNYFKLFTKSFTDGTIENGVASIAPIILKFVPFIGIFFRIMSKIPILGGMMSQLIWSLVYAGCYVIINMLNERNVQQLCNTELFGIHSDKIAFVIFLVISLVFNR